MFDPENLKKIANMKRPLAKYKDRTLIDLPITGGVEDDSRPDVGCREQIYFIER
jgi:hypothetical protein